MSSAQKAITICLWIAVAMGSAGVAAMLVMVQPPKSEPTKRGGEALYDAPEFSLTDQTGKKLGNPDLLGKVWIADFVFTRCAGPCPLMTLKMSEVQKQVDRPDVKLVSFTVDPEHDSPDVLKKYADRFGADHSRWHFLTGSKEAIYAIADGMKVTAKPATDEQPIIHSERFLLVDRKGQVVGVYHNNEPDEMKRLASDASELAERK